jgi:hypothetical protein
VSSRKDLYRNSHSTNFFDVVLKLLSVLCAYLHRGLKVFGACILKPIFMIASMVYDCHTNIILKEIHEMTFKMARS